MTNSVLESVVDHWQRLTNRAAFRTIACPLVFVPPPSPTNKRRIAMDSQPVKFSIDYPEKLSRGLLLLKTFLGWFYVLIPHMFVLFFYSIAAFFVTFIAWWAIL